MAVLTAKEVAAIFEVGPGAVAHWRKEKKIVGIEPPRGNRRIGYRYTVAAVEAFVRQLDDARTREQARAFYQAHGYELDTAS